MWFKNLWLRKQIIFRPSFIIRKTRFVWFKMLSDYRMSTSLSDNQVYPDFCLKAGSSYRVFKNFRRHPVYNEILEHTDKNLGQKYLDEIVRQPEFIERMEAFKRNDDWGNPKKCRYDSVGLISPSTLRYIKVLADLNKLFDSLNGKVICEIGAGYGGLCRVINAWFKPRKYYLVDIKPALILAQRYLDNYVIHSALAYKTMNELEINQYDLVISNYAFTECPREIQDVYLSKVILNSRCGYITYNENTWSYKKEELIRMIPNSAVMDEIPVTATNNCIIFWKN